MNISKLNLVNFSNGQTIEVSQSQNAVSTISKFSFFSLENKSEDKEFTKEQFESEIAKAKQQAFEEGYSKAKQEFDNYLKNEDIRIKDQVSSMLTRFLESLKKFKTEQAEYKLNLAKLSNEFVKKICANKINENSSEIFINAIENISKIIEKEPQILIKANETLIIKLQSSIEEFFVKNLPNTMPKFEISENLNHNEIYIEWEKSGISVNLNERINAIDEIFAEFIKTL
ncbi:MAG: FliH/SctL family protein [Rickettsiales bacterium]|nr:FliH/SctL family protein [Rickettsiales bacterium]